MAQECVPVDVASQHRSGAVDEEDYGNGQEKIASDVDTQNLESVHNGFISRLSSETTKPKPIEIGANANPISGTEGFTVSSYALCKKKGTEPCRNQQKPAATLTPAVRPAKKAKQRELEGFLLSRFGSEAMVETMIRCWQTGSGVANRPTMNRVTPSYRMYILLFASHGVTGKM